MRLDRSITLGVIQPLRQAIRAPDPRRSTLGAIPILMYHGISDEPEPGVPPYYQTNTTLAVFRQQMQFLADQGYRTISLDELCTVLRTPDSISRITHHASLSNAQLSTLNPQLIALTFDDGFRSFYTEAFPALQKHGFTATMFLPTAFIGDTRRYFHPATINPQRSTSKECLTWSKIRELRQAGIQFGSHTVNHSKLIGLDWPEIKSELSNSKSNIEQRLGELVTAFCYPFAFPQSDHLFVERLTALLRETGYLCCATTTLGRSRIGDDPYSLKRLPANSLDDAAFFAAKLEGAYDWLAAPQSAVKTLEAMVRPLRRSQNLTLQQPSTAPEG